MHTTLIHRTPYAGALAGIGLMLVPFLAFAQESSLRAQIRADLMQDPRTAQMSQAELDALVTALADEAQVSGEAETYLDAKGAPTFTYDPPPVSTENPVLNILLSPIVIAVLALLIGIIGLVIFALHRRHHAITPPTLT